MKLKPVLELSTDLTAEEALTGIPEITMGRPVNERPVKLSVHKVDVCVGGGFQIVVTEYIPTRNMMLVPPQRRTLSGEPDESVDEFVARSALIKNIGGE